MYFDSTTKQELKNKQMWRQKTNKKPSKTKQSRQTNAGKLDALQVHEQKDKTTCVYLIDIKQISISQFGFQYNHSFQRIAVCSLIYASGALNIWAACC